jgi:hypothetical protein
MFPMQVALVPYPDGLVPTDELLLVASTLQTQVSRDLAPVWGVSAVISPFLGLEDVPPGYIALGIVPKLPPQSHGFHVVEDGQPLALIGYRRGWSLLASHELLELLCDPWGNRRLPGRSLRRGQGQVEYLVEVCDPCQHETYTINGVVVSDFVTPEYYGPPGSGSGGRYSFTGRVKRALEVRAGGSLSWRTASGQIWQQAGGDAPRRLSHVTFSRAVLDGHRDAKRPDVADKLPKRTGPGPHNGLDQTAREYGKDLKKNIDLVLEQLGAKPPRARLEDVMRLVEELAKDGSSARAGFTNKAAAVETLAKYNLDPPPNLNKNLPLRPAKHFQDVLAHLKGGLTVGDPKLAEALSTHAVFHIPAGIE